MSSISTPPTTRVGLIHGIASSVGQLMSKLKESIASTPLFYWIYIGAMLYITRQITYRYGYTQKRHNIGGRVVYLSSAESDMAENVVNLDKIDETFNDVGGLESIKATLTEHIVWPFKNPALFTGKTMRSHPKGVLLYGPPGTGKTLLARALAKELGCSFINVSTESIFSKWVGDTEKNAASVFSLAEKIAPCVIFIDEIDSLLSSRNAMDSTPHTHAKTIFMTRWDGLEKNNDARIIVIGATNRRLTIDDAIRRRLPLQMEIPTPDKVSREKILRILLVNDLEGNPRKEALIRYVTSQTERYTGSDLTELCKAAALMPLRELHATQPLLGGGSKNSTPVEPKVPPLTQEHFDLAMQRVKASS